MSSYPQLRAFQIWIYASRPNRLQIIPPPTNHLTVRIIALKRLLSICYQFVIKRPFQSPQTRINAGFTKHFCLFKLLGG